MLLSELSGPKDYLGLPHLNKRDIRILWHSDFWDMPVNGLLLYQGERYWFQASEDVRYNDAANVIYLVIQLSRQQVEEQEHWHDLFRQKVGTHTDYDEHGNRDMSAQKPRSTHREFYDVYDKRNKLDLTSNQVIGWVEG
jgi:hypothetical protein